MSSEETESDVEVNPEGLNSGEGFVAHTRRKRSRSGRSSFSGVGVSPADEVFYTASCEGKYKDVGWEHGEMVVPGNRFSWKCKWCGLVRCSGGVTRLKKHLAGAKHISPCQKVPEHVARAMKDNLLELEKKQLGRHIKKHNDITKMRLELLCLDTSVKREAGETDLDVQMSNATQQSERTAKSSKTAREQSRDSNQPSLFASRRSKTNMAKVSNGTYQSNGVPTRSRLSSQRSRSSYKRSSICNQRHEAELAKQSMKGTQDTMLCTKTYDKDGFARKDDHWRIILGNMLHLPDLCEGGGIRTCIIDALTSGPSDLSRMFKMTDVTKDTVDPKDSYRGHCEEQRRFSRPNIPAKTQLNLPETETYYQKLAVTNTMKCQEVFLDLLCSEKFVLMCDLLGKNFQDINAKKLFDFSQINLKMKNGVYEQSPGVFNQDIQQVWRKFQRIGQEMVLCASDLSNMSGDFYQKAVGEDVVCEDVVNEAVELQCEAR
ncbi:PHD finger protein EHD3-like [Iris pallida]|uniref:PHD finger protein EHD3-like n=1 Tax=Iris pallida TaxID=29817 RepID=A0AAX6HKQ7_IRIPA|nr:PHD finger protein EHD3-like [Iris pallida]KAJ6841333.1 PHD finger protein EHD3-like [Iris pallida]